MDRLVGDSNYESSFLYKCNLSGIKDRGNGNFHRRAAAYWFWISGLCSARFVRDIRFDSIFCFRYRLWDYGCQNLMGTEKTGQNQFR